MRTKETFPSVEQVSDIDLLSTPFFQPDDEFVKWLVKYANGRVIVDCGAGSGYLCALIQKHKGKCIGIEPRWNKERRMFWFRSGYEFNVLNDFAEESMALDFPADKTLFVFARPCHSGFAERTIKKACNKGIETLYIGLPENVTTDLPLFRFVKLYNDGTSKENEIVLSIK